MNRSLVARFILRLEDRVSAGLGALASRLQRLGAAARNIALGGLLGSGLAVAGPIAQAAQLEQSLRQMGITAGFSGQEVERAMRENLTLFQGVARETNQRVRDLAGAAGVLIAGGGQAGEVWRELVPIIGRVATASGASAQDLSQTVLSVVNNLRVAPAEAEQVLAALVQAGKEGQFELRDMAGQFAALSAQAAGLGMTGPRAVHSIAAALQVARQGAGSASEAANNLANTFRQMTSTEARKGFREIGVDLERVMESANRQGINPLEAVIQKLRERTGGNMFRVQEIFADSQVLGFLRPMIAETARYIEIRERAAGAGAELISTDQETAMRGLAAALQRLTVATDEFVTRIGAAAEGPLRLLGDALFWAADKMRELDEAFPGLIDNAAFFAAGAVALATAIGGLGLVVGPLAAGLAALLSPIGLLVIAAAGLAAAIYLHWGEIGPFVSGVWDGVRERFDAFAGWVSGWASGAWAAAVGLILAPVTAVVEAIAAAFARAQQIASAVAGAFSRGQAAQGEQPAPAPGEGQRRMGSRGALGGFPPVPEMAGAAAGPGGPARAELSGELRLVLPPGVRLEAANTDAPGLNVTSSGGGEPARGATRGRP